MPLALEPLQHFPGVAAVAQGGVVAHLPRLDVQHLHNFIHHDGNVGPGGRFAALDDFLHIRLILFRIQFLVFFPEIPGMGALVADPPLMLLFHGAISFSQLENH